MNINMISVAILNLIALCYCFPNVYPRIKFEAKNYQNTGEPLYITPFIKNGSIDEAQELSKVLLTEELGVKSHAGFFTINEELKSNHYFWYFPPISGDEDAPVVLWLQGGPGASSLFGLFMEIGPLIAKKDRFEVRQYHWALTNHLIFIDNPVGTGFSHTGSEDGYCKDEECVANDLYISMTQFFQLFPYLQKNEFYITGESYAGKYVPSLAKKIHDMRAIAKPQINLKGIAMGNGYCDPINQIDYGKYLYQHGLLDSQQTNLFEVEQNQIKSYIKREKWLLAAMTLDNLIDGDIGNFSYFKNFTGFTNFYNILKPNDNTDDMTIFAELLSKDEVRKNVHVGGLPFNSGKKVLLNLAEDAMQSVAPKISELLNHYRVLVYNGQLDIVVAYPLTENFLKNLNFSSSKEYLTAERKLWYVGEDLAGYVKMAGNLTEILVRDSGHMVPHDQPIWALDLITRFITRKPFA